MGCDLNRSLQEKSREISLHGCFVPIAGIKKPRG
jgi:hypothetical protein